MFCCKTNLEIHQILATSLDRRLLVWMMMLLGSGWLAGSWPAFSMAEDGQPCIVLEPNSLDFGVVHQLEHFRREVVVHNTGTARLEIQQITTSCGCAVAETITEQLAPGDSTLLTVDFSSKRFLGPQTRFVRLHTNDPVQPVCELRVYSDVRVPIEVDPPERRLALGRLKRGETSAREAWLRSEVVPALELKPAQLKPDLMDITIVTDPAGDPQRAGMVVAANPAAPSGRYREIVRLETNVSTMPHVDIEISWHVLHDIELSHYHMDFRYVKPDQRLTRKVRVWASDPEVSFTVIGAEIDLPGFTVKTEEVRGENATLVTLNGQSLPLDDPQVVTNSGRLQGILRILTDHPEQPELQVKVTYILRI